MSAASEGADRRAGELAGQVREAEAELAALRAERDAAICAAVRAGYTTRAIGRGCALTASQVSAIWRRDHPARPRRGPAPR